MSVSDDGSVRLVSLQFSFSNPDVIPSSVKHLSSETPEERIERKSRSGGVMIIAPTEKCSLAEILGELEAAGYELVDAFYKERIDAKNPNGKGTYHMVRFLFAKHEFAMPSDEFKAVREVIRAELQGICESAMWRVRAFSNPFYRSGEEVPGQRAVSVNMEVRQPLFRPDGQPVTVWQKDKNGERVGDAPLPIRPACVVRMSECSRPILVAV